MCFSFDGGALAVGHEGALTVWSTEDGSRLVSTVSHAYQSGSHGTPSSAHLRAVSETPSQLNGGTAHTHSVYNGDVRGNGGEIGVPRENIMSPARSTLDLVAGGARSLTWECEGYRLLSVTGQGVVRGAHASSGEGMAPEARDGEAQNIVAFDFFRRARSNLSSALLTMQVRLALFPFAVLVLLNHWVTLILPVRAAY